MARDMTAPPQAPIAWSSRKQASAPMECVAAQAMDEKTNSKRLKYSGGLRP
jgi:hypothetical protein